jgi:hypothetical protein
MHGLALWVPVLLKVADLTGAGRSANMPAYGSVHYGKVGDSEEGGSHDHTHVSVGVDLP